jgi:tRNA pseudouridine55 synthase
MLLVDKPAGMTSHDVVQVVRRKLATTRIGHTGTLDPIARGLLILLVGPTTKYQQAFQRHEKTYEAILKLGTQTDTGDAAGRPITTAAVPEMNREEVAQVLASFQGAISQVPPTYSAVKVRGRPAYWWARRRTPVRLPARIVHIAELSLVDVGTDTVTFRTQCSAGTYIRTLGEAIAERLGTVGHIAGLVRFRIGAWNLNEAVPFAWIAQASPEAIIGCLQPITRPSSTSSPPVPR